MEIRQQLETALKDSLRSGDEARKRTVRMALSNIKFVEKEKGTSLDEAGVIAILQKEIKIRKEALQESQKANREDLIKENQEEIAILEAFLPKMMSEEEIQAVISQVIEEVQAKSPADMGKVMKAALPKLQGKAANDQVSALVRKLLQN
jgi:uncharacterized protein YqeY